MNAGDPDDDITPLQRLARAVLLFHNNAPWNGEARNTWTMLTGETDATPQVLCNLARRLALEDHEAMKT